jgi:hypothetical protein
MAQAIEQEVDAMAFVVIWGAPGLSGPMYESTLKPVFDAQPAGLLAHLSGRVEEGWRGVTVWESQVAADQFGGSGSLQRALETLGLQEQLTFTAWYVQRSLTASMIQGAF